MAAHLNNNRANAAVVQRRRHSNPDALHASTLRISNAFTSDVMDKFSNANRNQSRLALKVGSGGSQRRRSREKRASLAAQKSIKRTSFIPADNDDESEKKTTGYPKPEFHRINHPNSIQSVWPKGHRQSIEDYQKGLNKRMSKGGGVPRPKRQIMPREVIKKPNPPITTVMADFDEFTKQVECTGPHTTQIIEAMINAKKFTKVEHVMQESYTVEYNVDDVDNQNEKHSKWAMDMKSMDLKYKFDINGKNAKLYVKCSEAWRKRNNTKNNEGDTLMVPVLFAVKYDDNHPSIVRIIGAISFKQQYGTRCLDLE